MKSPLVLTRHPSRRKAAAELLADRHAVCQSVGDHDGLARTGARPRTEHELRDDRPCADGAARGAARSPKVSAEAERGAERPAGLTRPLSDAVGLTEDACEGLVGRDLKSIGDCAFVARGGVAYGKRRRIISNRGSCVRADDARRRNRDGGTRAAAAIAAATTATADGGGNH